MAITTTSIVAPHIMDEILQANALMPLRGSHVAIYLQNSSNIDGVAPKRSISQRTAFADPVADTEGTNALATPVTVGYGSNIELTPTKFVQFVQFTPESVSLVFGSGLKYEQVKAAMLASANTMNPAMLPLIKDAYVEVLRGFNDLKEKQMLALHTGLSENAQATTNTTLSIATLLAAKAGHNDNLPENADTYALIGQDGHQQLMAELLAGSGTALSNIWSNGIADGMLKSVGLNAQSPAIQGAFTLFGLGPVFIANKSWLPTVNAAVDRVGAVLSRGSGPAGAPGSLRGAFELCELFAPSLSLAYDDSVDALGIRCRASFIAGEHTDAHGVKFYYKAV